MAEEEEQCPIDTAIITQTHTEVSSKITSIEEGIAHTKEGIAHTQTKEGFCAHTKEGIAHTTRKVLHTHTKEGIAHTPRKVLHTHQGRYCAHTKEGFCAHTKEGSADPGRNWNCTHRQMMKRLPYRARSTIQYIRLVQRSLALYQGRHNTQRRRTTNHVALLIAYKW